MPILLVRGSRRRTVVNLHPCDSSGEPSAVKGGMSRLEPATSSRRTAARRSSREGLPHVPARCPSPPVPSRCSVPSVGRRRAAYGAVPARRTAAVRERVVTLGAEDQDQRPGHPADLAPHRPAHRPDPPALWLVLGHGPCLLDLRSMVHHRADVPRSCTRSAGSQARSASQRRP